MKTAPRDRSANGPILPSADRPYFVVIDGGDVLLDDDTWANLDDCGNVAAPRPIATFPCIVAARRAIARFSLHKQHAAAGPGVSHVPKPFWID